MKSKLLLMILAFVQAVAIAHPRDTDSYSNLGVGTKLVLNRPLNIAPNQTGVSFANAFTGPSCYLVSNFQPVSYDRAITGSLTVVEKNEDSGLLFLSTDDGHSVILGCSPNSSIEDFKQLVGSAITVHLAVTRSLKISEH